MHEKDKIEKYILRKAFDTPENPYLPQEVLWRQKGFLLLNKKKKYLNFIFFKQNNSLMELDSIGSTPSNLKLKRELQTKSWNKLKKNSQSIHQQPKKHIGTGQCLLVNYFPANYKIKIFSKKKKKRNVPRR